VCALKVPRQCPLVPLIEGKALRSENGKALGSGLGYEQRKFISKTFTNSIRTSLETYYVSATKPNRLMLFRETVAVYCENHTEHTDTLCGQNAEF
jgi:hypothetical protein